MRLFLHPSVTAFVAVLLLGMIPLANAFQITWQSPWPTNYDLFDAQALDSLTVWACGAGGVIIHTTDAGQSWAQVETGSRRSNRCVFFLDFVHAWIGSDSGRVLHTQDGGENWQWSNLPTQLAVVQAMFATPLKGWAVAGEFCQTSDGGSSWAVLPTPDFHIPDFYALDSLTIAAAVVGGDTNGFARSTDGGNSWEFQNLPPDHRLQGIAFADSLHGWAWGFILGSPSNGLYYQSYDGGVSWSASTDSIASLDFVNASEGMGYGPGYSTFAITADSGNTWQLVDRPAYDYTLRFAYGGSGCAWLVGDLGHLHATSDSAQSWVDQSPAPRTRLDEVQFLNGQDGWCGGEFGTVMRTHNGGQSWESVYVDSNESFYGLAFLDESHGILAAYSGEIFFSIDGGEIWTRAAQVFNDALWGVAGSGARAWAVGAWGTILRSDDYGATWQILRTGYDEFLGLVDVVADSVVWVGGENFVLSEPVLLRTTDAGETWESVSVSQDLSVLGGMEFDDATSGWLSGSSSVSKVLVTHDGGVTWTTVYTGPVHSLGTLLKFNDSTLVSLASDGVMLSSTNLGQAWEEHELPPDRGLRVLSHVGPTEISVVGEFGTVLRVSPEFGNAGSSDRPVLPYEFSLHVYPNPSNSVSVITISLSSPTILTVDLYDILGRRCLSLGERQLMLGDHSIVMNLKSLPSGHYYLEARTPDATRALPLIILR